MREAVRCTGEGQGEEERLRGNGAAEGKTVVILSLHPMLGCLLVNRVCVCVYEGGGGVRAHFSLAPEKASQTDAERFRFSPCEFQKPEVYRGTFACGNAAAAAVVDARAANAQKRARKRADDDQQTS